MINNDKNIEVMEWRDENDEMKDDERMVKNREIK